MTNQWQRWKGIMKAVPFEEKRLLKWQPPYIVQPKYDGFRCRAVPTDTGYLIVSSEENVFFSVPHINAELNRLGLNSELDGELYCHGVTFEQVSSIVSRSVNISPEHRLIEFHVFDIVNDEPQLKRSLMIENLRNLSRWITVSPFYICEDLDSVLSAYDKIIEQGYEGIIIRHINNNYVRKRSTLVMKFKPKQEDTYTIIGSTEEVSITGEYKDTLGSLICLSKSMQITNETQIAINLNKMNAVIDGNIYDVFTVGSGFKDHKRKVLWEGRQSLIGKTARVKYQHITSGKGVPRFPIFVEVIDNE